MKTTLILVYITCTSKEQAQDIGEALLKARVAACINIIPGMTSTYWWPPQSNELESAEEVILIAKTVENMFEPLKEKVIELHNADTPCVLAIPVTQASEKYEKWIKDELKTE